MCSFSSSLRDFSDCQALRYSTLLSICFETPFFKCNFFTVTPTSRQVLSVLIQSHCLNFRGSCSLARECTITTMLYFQHSVVSSILHPNLPVHLLKSPTVLVSYAAAITLLMFWYTRRSRESTSNITMYSPPTSAAGNTKRRWLFDSANLLQEGYQKVCHQSHELGTLHC